MDSCCDAKSSGKAFYELGFAGAQIAAQPNHLAPLRIAPPAFPKRFGFHGAMRNACSHLRSMGAVRARP
jgi:hypothetical protein